MADFEVNVNGVMNCASSFEAYSKILRSVAEESGSLLSQLRGSLSTRVGGVAARVSICTNAKLCQADMTNLSKAARQAVQVYVRHENNVKNKGFTKNKVGFERIKEQFKDLMGSFGKAVKKKAEQVKNRAIKKVKRYIDKAKEAIKKTGENIKKGYEHVKGKIVYTIDFLKENYKNKGSVYKAVQYGKAAVKAIGGVSKVVVGVASLLGSGGLSSLASGLSIVSGINDIVNAGADIYNTHNDNFDEIGKVNVLKDTLAYAGGKVGEVLGNEELGQKIGKAVFYGMEAYTAYANFSNAVDKVKQLNKTNIAELKNDLEAIGNLKIDLGKIMTTDIQQLKYEFALGKMYFKSATNFVSNVSALNSAVSGGAKVVQKGNEVVNSFLKSDNELKKGFDLHDASNEYKKYIGIGKTCKKIDDNTEIIGNIITLMLRQKAKSR